MRAAQSPAIVDKSAEPSSVAVDTSPTCRAE
jgi:hypothetical protein